LWCTIVIRQLADHDKPAFEHSKRRRQATIGRRGESSLKEGGSFAIRRYFCNLTDKVRRRRESSRRPNRSWPERICFIAVLVRVTPTYAFGPARKCSLLALDIAEENATEMDLRDSHSNE
jgi:hypothetical protein